jgi:hypothetical protein
MTNVYKPGLIQARPQYDSDTDAPDKPENVLWLLSRTTTVPTLAQLEAIQSIFDNNWYNVWAAVGANTKHYTGSILTDWSSATGLQSNSVGTFPPGIGGQGSALPANVAALISIQIPLRFRGGHFRIYLPWIGSSALDSTDKNKLSTTVQTNLSNAFGTYITAMSASDQLGGQIAVVYKNRNNPATAQTYAFPSYTAQQMLASQRRRLRRAAHK